MIENEKISNRSEASDQSILDLSVEAPERPCFLAKMKFDWSYFRVSVAILLTQTPALSRHSNHASRDLSITHIS
jgi:hypothetical protein